MIRNFLVLMVMSLYASSGFALNDNDEPLPPEQAFVLSATAPNANTLRVSVAITDGYYMYREKFKFTPDSSGVTFGNPSFPKGKIKTDEFFGKVETYRSLRQQLALGFEEMEQILEHLSSAALVRRVGAGWVQSRDPTGIMVADIYRLFAFSPEAVRASVSGDAKLKQLLDDIDAGISEKMNLSLATFFAETPSLQPVAT